jgi:glycosyltransferase involved in cell wall biosynthesis
MTFAKLKVALVHDWLVTYRGGEKVLEALCELFPQAEIFTLLHKKGAMAPRIEARPIHTSFVQRLPFALERHRQFLPLFPRAIETFDLKGFDLAVSSSHCVAKGARVPSGVPHVSYVHAPMRYMWDLFDDYFGPGRASFPVRTAARALRPYLQRWDRQSAQPITRIVANSQNIAAKIGRFWGRSAEVVHPPVDLERFAAAPLEGLGQGGYFLWVGALAPYKRIDLALEAFGRLGAPLWIAGSGQDDARVRSLPKNIRFLGQVSDEELVRLYRDARALVFPGEEDFGITPLEAQACGRPVIALARGGALETVRSDTGLFFAEQTVEGLVDAVRSFDDFERRFVPAQARENALRFSRQAFLERFAEVVRGLGRSDSSVRAA